MGMKISINATCFTNEPSGAKNRFIGVYGHLFNHFPEDEFFVFEPKDMLYLIENLSGKVWKLVPVTDTVSGCS